jgi:hypothetical protein
MTQIKSHNIYFLVVSIFLGVLTTLLHYSFGNNDHIEQLPIIYRTLDPNYLTNDFFVNSNAGFSPRYYYAQVVSFFGSFMGIPLFFLIGTLLSNIAISVLTYINATLLLKNQKTAILTAACVMLFPTLHLGGDLVLFGSMFTPTTLVFPFVLLAFYFFLKKNMILCFITTGAISLVHILIGLEYGMLLFFTWVLVDFLQKKSLKSVLKKVPFLAIVIVFLLPNLIPYFETKASIDNTLFIEILAHFRHPHHYVLSEILSLGEILKLGIILTIILLTWKAFVKKAHNKDHTASIAIIGMLLAGAILLNWIFIEWIPVKEITTLQLLRLLNFGKWIFMLLLVNYIHQSIIGKGNRLHEVMVFALFIFLVTLSGVSLIKLFVLITISTWALYLLFTQRKQLLLISLPLILTGIFVLNQAPIPFLQPYQKQFLSTSDLSESQKEVSLFIQSHTDEHAVFLTPPLFGFLRTEAKRAIVVDFKAFPFQEIAMQEWYQRINDCYGLDKEIMHLSYQDITDEKIVQLQKKYGFDYAVLNVGTVTKIPTIYSNSEYKIIDLASYAQ